MCWGNERVLIKIVVIWMTWWQCSRPYSADVQLTREHFNRNQGSIVARKHSILISFVSPHLLLFEIPNYIALAAHLQSLCAFWVIVGRVVIGGHPNMSVAATAANSIRHEIETRARLKPNHSFYHFSSCDHLFSSLFLLDGTLFMHRCIVQFVWPKM